LQALDEKFLIPHDDDMPNTLPPCQVKRSPANRSIKFNYAVSPDTFDVEADERKVAQVFVYHNTGTRQYRASLNLVTVEKQGSFNVESYMLFNGVTLRTESVARYSAKGLETFAQSIIDALPGMIADSEKVAAVFAGEGAER
jgi:hypothetical protein